MKECLTMHSVSGRMNAVIESIELPDDWERFSEHCCTWLRPNKLKNAATTPFVRSPGLRSFLLMKYIRKCVQKQKNRCSFDRKHTILSIPSPEGPRSKPPYSKFFFWTSRPSKYWFSTKNSEKELLKSISKCSSIRKHLKLFHFSKVRIECREIDLL